MAHTHTYEVTLSLKEDTEPALTTTNTTTLTQVAELNLDVTVLAGATDQVQIVFLDQSRIDSIYMVCDQGLTIETDSATIPTDTIVLVANEPYYWHSGLAAALEITADFNTLYLTNASATSDATFKIRSLITATDT